MPWEATAGVNCELLVILCDAVIEVDLHVSVKLVAVIMWAFPFSILMFCTPFAMSVCDWVCYQSP